MKKELEKMRKECINMLAIIEGLISSHASCSQVLELDDDYLRHLDWSSNKNNWRWVTASALAVELGLPTSKRVATKIGSDAEKYGAKTRRGAIA